MRKVVKAIDLVTSNTIKKRISLIERSIWILDKSRLNGDSMRKLQKYELRKEKIAKWKSLRDKNHSKIL